MPEQPDGSAAEVRSLAKWYAAARAALAHNRPLTSSAAPGHPRSRDLSSGEVEALHRVGAFKNEAPIRPERDPLLAAAIALNERSDSRYPNSRFSIAL